MYLAMLLKERSVHINDFEWRDLQQEQAVYMMMEHPNSLIMK